MPWWLHEFEKYELSWWKRLSSCFQMFLSFRATAKIIIWVPFVNKAHGNICPILVSKWWTYSGGGNWVRTSKNRAWRLTDRTWRIDIRTRWEKYITGRRKLWVTKFITFRNGLNRCYGYVRVGEFRNSLTIKLIGSSLCAYCVVSREWHPLCYHLAYSIILLLWNSYTSSTSVLPL